MQLGFLKILGSVHCSSEQLLNPIKRRQTQNRAHPNAHDAPSATDLQKRMMASKNRSLAKCVAVILQIIENHSVNRKTYSKIIVVDIFYDNEKISPNVNKSWRNILPFLLEIMFKKEFKTMSCNNHTQMSYYIQLATRISFRLTMFDPCSFESNLSCQRSLRLGRFRVA